MLLVFSGSLLKGLGLDRVRLPRLDLGAGMGRAPPPTQQAGERKQYKENCRRSCYIDRCLETMHCLSSRRVGRGVCEKHRRRDCEDDRTADLKRAAAFISSCCDSSVTALDVRRRASASFAPNP